MSVKLSGKEYTLCVSQGDWMAVASGFVQFIPVRTRAKYAQGDIIYLIADDARAGAPRQKGYKVEESDIAISLGVLNVMRGGPCLVKGFQLLSIKGLESQDGDAVTTETTNPLMKKL